MLCDAGCIAKATFSCLDGFGNALQEGGALPRGQCTSQAQDATADSQTCEVTHRGNGVYALSFCLRSAGPFQVSKSWMCCCQFMLLACLVGVYKAYMSWNT